MNKAWLLGAVVGLTPMYALAADLAPAPRFAPAPLAAPYNPWAGFYGGISFGWNWGDGANVTLPQAAAGQPGFVGDTFRGPVFLEAQDRFLAASAACVAPCVATDTDFALPGIGFVGREQERGGAVFTLNGGYNWQFGSFVVGVEADLSAMNRRHEGAFAGAGTADYEFATPVLTTGGEFPSITQQGVLTRGVYETDGDFATRARMHWLTTARLRAGFAAGDFLLYATGGLAAGRASMSAVGTVDERFTETTRVTQPVGLYTPPPVYGAPTTNYTAASTTTWRGRSGSGTDFGWTLGGGVEWMTGKGFSLKAEYLYYDLGDQTIVAAGTTTTTVGTGANAVVTTTAAAPIRIRQDLNGHIFRVGLNFGFSAAPKPVAPVVAAY